MAGVFGYSIPTELQSGASSGFGPMPACRIYTGSTPRRVHPYMGYSAGSHVHGENFGTELCVTNNVTGVTEPGKYLSGSGPVWGTGAFLANSLYNQDLLSLNAQTFNTNVPQNLSVPTAEAGSSFPTSLSATRKDRNHPLYSRKRVEPAESMTRKKDKYRVVYTEKQRKGLEKEYNTNKFITAERKAKISEELNLSERQIKIWFQNRRAKERRDSRKGKDTEQTGNGTEVDNNTIDSLAGADFSTSCRFTGSEVQSEEMLYSSGQCRFMNKSESGETNTFRSASSNACFFTSRDSGALRHSASPLGLSALTENRFLSSLDVSPLTGNLNFDIELRL
ncbi:homeobox protein CHOX-CAD-like [Mercenaria mercenaria]|uniref:homeobox protein CHOX-CAD-like n=1 Tax=Mercenaria mercenaria TaxID=6596 RepID=UPI00234E3DD6|nr:homeobox protein CHOX-CAD-like [Mercenaria mercenaria]